MADPIGHFRTICRHRRLVRQHCFRCGLYWQGLTHDLSKFSPAEFIPGAKYYQGSRSPNNAQREAEGSSSAWLHHKGRNRHHHEYWNDLDLRSMTIVDGLGMPKKYIAEMLCDRVAASKVYCGAAYDQTKPWEHYQRNLGLHRLAPETEMLLEKCLALLRDEGEERLWQYIREEMLGEPDVPPLPEPEEIKTMSPFRVVTCTDERNGGKVWVLQDNVRHYLMDFSALGDWGFEPWSVELISMEELQSIPLSFPINRRIKDETDIRTHFDARSLLLQDVLHGRGVEFGAACYPMPVPPDCAVQYADYFPEDQGCNADMHGEFVPLSYKTSFTEMAGIRDGSLNFILSSHVIEHTKDPIGVFYAAWKKLRPGGVLFMAVPHMDYTFDHARALTPTEHLIKDYKLPSRERDAEHIEDFLHFADLPGHNSDCDVKPIMQSYIQGQEYDLHWHTFTEHNFTEMTEWINKHVCHWTSIRIIPHINFNGSNEFYVLAVK